jgi:protease-4
MLKRFFVSMLGTIAGIWISIILIVISLIAIGTAVFSSKMFSDSVGKHSILHITLKGNVSERFQPGSIVDFIQSPDEDAVTLDELMTALRIAADDDKIDGVYLECEDATMGVASREEFLSALKAFKKSGKWIYAYADNYGQGDYLVASAADKVFLNPVGSVDLRGVATVVPHFKGLLDKVGVKVQVVKVGTYKSAVEPFVLTSMSDAARLQNQVYIDSIWNFMSANIALNRGVKQSAVDSWADGIMSTWTADSILKVSAVTELKYRRQVEDILREKVGVDKEKELPFVTLSDYLATNDILSSNNDSDHIAVLYAVGDIVDSGKEGISGVEMVSEIVKLADDKHVRGLVFRVNSGGGSAFASEQIWEALEYFKSKNKPYYVSMGDYAASGGYYISCGADKIYADATTLTGSIGVFGMIPDFSGLATDKLGVTFSTVESNRNADYMSTLQPMTDEQMNALQGSVNNIYEKFVGRVAKGRQLSVASVKAIAEGRVWIGTSAKRLKLVDNIGGLNQAIADMAKKLNMQSSQTVSYPNVDEELLMKIIRQTGSVKMGGMTIDAQTFRMLHFVDKLRTMNPVQARIEESIIF